MSKKNAPLANKKNNQWVLAEDMPDVDLFFSQIFLKMYVTSLKNHAGIRYKKCLAKFQGYNLWFYYDDRDSLKVGDQIVDKMIQEDGFIAEINANIIKQADQLREFASSLQQTGLDQLSDQALWQLYDRHYQLHSAFYIWCGIPVAADLYRSNLSNRLKEYLRGFNLSPEKVNEYFITLTQSSERSLMFYEQEELLKIANLIQQDTRLEALFKTADSSQVIADLPSPILNLIEKHKNKYYFTKHIWVSGEYSLVDYVNQLSEIINQGRPVSKILQDQNRQFDDLLIKQKAIFDELGMDAKWQKIFKGVGQFMVTKVYRRYAQLLALHHMSPLLKEIAKRKYLTEQQVRFMLRPELAEMLLENKHDEATLLQRSRACVYYLEGDKEQILTGPAAASWLKQVEVKIQTEVEKIEGEVACGGYARGPVKIVLRAEDMAKMGQGDILVSVSTNPDIVPAMKKAGAIVTDAGGVTSHAAIVSRELNIPCVIGTKIATQVLKDGDLVEVDAEKGIVRKI